MIAFDPEFTVHFHRLWLSTLRRIMQETVRRNLVVGYDHEKDRWLLRAGATSGIPATGDTTILVNDDPTSYKLGTVYPGFSELELPPSYDKDRTYAATIQSMHWDGKLRMAFSTETPPEAQKVFLKELDEYQASEGHLLYLAMTENSDSAEFLIIEEAESYYLVKSGSEVPLFQRCPAGQLTAFFRYADMVGKWCFWATCDNPNSRLSKDDFEIEVTRYEPDKAYTPEIIDWHSPITFSYGTLEGKNPEISLSIKSNVSKRLYVSIAWLCADFEIVEGLIPPTEELEQADSGNLSDAKPIRMSYYRKVAKSWTERIKVAIPEKMIDIGISEADEFIKIIVSTNKISSLKQQSVPLDKEYYSKKRGPTESDDILKIAIEEWDDWTTFTIPLKVVKPQSSIQVDGAKKNSIRLLNHEITVPDNFKATIGAVSKIGGKRSGGRSLPTVLQEISPYELSPGIANGDPISSIIFSNVDKEGIYNVTEDTPILMALNEDSISANELVFSVGYDPETGLYYPVGFENDGNLQIEILPEPMANGKKSFGGSIVLFLKKIVLETAKQEVSNLYKLGRVSSIPENLKEKPTYDYDLDSIRTAVKNANRILLCTHGIIGDTMDMVKFTERVGLEKKYDLVLAFDYENLDTEIEKIAFELKQKLVEVGLVEGHGKTLHVVAHSMGGLVSRWFVEQMGGDKFISHLVMVGTPNKGSHWASVAQYVTVGLAFAMNFLEFEKSTQLLLRFLGKYGDRALTTLQQMNPNSDFMEKLNRVEKPPIPYSVLAGDIMSIKPETVKSFFERIALGFKKGVARPVFRSANDIACTVGSIQGVPFVNGPVEPIPCDHLSYFEDENGLKALEIILNNI